MTDKCMEFVSMYVYTLQQHSLLKITNERTNSIHDRRIAIKNICIQRRRERKALYKYIYTLASFTTLWAHKTQKLLL